MGWGGGEGGRGYNCTGSTARIRTASTDPQCYIYIVSNLSSPQQASNLTVFIRISALGSYLVFRILRLAHIRGGDYSRLGVCLIFTICSHIYHYSKYIIHQQHKEERTLLQLHTGYLRFAVGGGGGAYSRIGGYELLTIGVGYHTLISCKHEWNSSLPNTG